jgi:uncharacterized protein UPF0158
MATVKYAELLAGLEFVSSGAPFEHDAYIGPDTGTIFWVSSMTGDLEDEVPDDFETSDRYIPVPHKNDLDVGRDLVLSFIERELPGEYDTVTGFFRSKGAYRRFKNLLEARNLLERWYSFEAAATEQALRSWCEANGIKLINEQTSG